MASCDATGPMAMVCLSLFMHFQCGIALRIKGRLTGVIERRNLVQHDLHRRDFLIGVKILDYALADEEQRENQRQR